MDCARCGSANADGKRFCGDCGASLGPTPPVPAAAPAAERRQLTVMFCDLVGSVALGSRLDPEDIRDVIAAYHSNVAALIEEHGGFVAQYLGDGVMAYFGYPQAREEDAERAVRAGLAAVAVVARLETVAGPAGTLQARVGIASGLVVVGEMAQTHSAVGDTPNLAARLQTFAQPGTVVTDAATRRQIGGLFACQELGAHELKGFPDAVAAWRVDAENAVQNRFEALRPAALAPLVGRDEELDLLLRRWRQARQGEGRLVLVSGEPGIGKSRLVAALEERLSGEAFARLRYFCSPHRQDSALHPVITHLEHAAGFAREDNGEENRRKLLALLGPTPAEDVALLSDLLSLPPGGAPALNLTPQRRKERTFEVLLRQLEGLAPALMVFEDAHWADPSSRELLDLLIERLPRLSILVLVTFRPEFQPPWIGRAGTTLLALSRLDRRDAAVIAARVADTELAGDLLDRILTEADGIPLFVEEITNAVLEGGGGERIAVPVSLKASLMARLDRLPAGKEVAQIGAAIGRVFPYELVEAVAQFPATHLRQGLEDLVASGLAFRRGVPPDATYTFKHALVQDVAYESLLRTRRTVLHGGSRTRCFCKIRTSSRPDPNCWGSTARRRAGPSRRFFASCVPARSRQRAAHSPRRSRIWRSPFALSPRCPKVLGVIATNWECRPRWGRYAWQPRASRAKRRVGLTNGRRSFGRS
ncbi:MAG: AAA family ATPase [Acetobacteraceae bacterium]